ncbi:hypothetical protein N9E57_00970 [Gammaproteobacteria bacterium]|nr:hypothetical protein [Gammaproteobacteria bacterium]
MKFKHTQAHYIALDGTIDSAINKPLTNAETRFERFVLNCNPSAW